jgi:hypothetical protein
MTDARVSEKQARIPVDVERELTAMFAAVGEPLHIEEVLEALGTLRLRKQRVSAASDLRQIILASRKRKRKAAGALATYSGIRA